MGNSTGFFSGLGDWWDNYQQWREELSYENARFVVEITYTNVDLDSPEGSNTVSITAYDDKDLLLQTKSFKVE